MRELRLLLGVLCVFGMRVPAAHADVLHPTGVSIEATAGQEFDAEVARFGSTSTDTSIFTASIDWGDGTTSAGQITRCAECRDPEYSVRARHAYAAEGTYDVAIVITDNRAAVSAPVASTVKVGPASHTFDPSDPSGLETYPYPVGRTVTIRYQPPSDDEDAAPKRPYPRDCGNCFKGKIFPADRSYPACFTDAVVVLRRRVGADERIGRAQSATDGSWELQPDQLPHGSYYAVVDNLTTEGVACGAATSEPIAAGEVKRTLTINFVDPSDPSVPNREPYPRDCGSCFQGKIFSDPVCNPDTVTVFERRKGADRRVGSDRSAANGRWELRERNASGEFYAVIESKSVAGAYCAGAQSKGVSIDG
jgi:hypothetical protein